ncbi:hypothetical protein A1O7_08967 [Cladophialophora yegresii CBS 114405]|uniref:Uncharacterized protein n=1 Tax=Cladophialophora yegresii CBS 114405 TaxID=1182544 RepID=W9VV49_9EURO|nr:uncharacterized protein A1O7_08967 [Cladophialophora yegresii CBS 114405]EXJ56036.1 hypothetical protein A1O7_08967 [Cladophialophora yegresii CBS 114405]
MKHRYQTGRQYLNRIDLVGILLSCGVFVIFSLGPSWGWWPISREVGGNHHTDCFRLRHLGGVGIVPADALPDTPVPRLRGVGANAAIVLPGEHLRLCCCLAAGRKYDRHPLVCSRCALQRRSHHWWVSGQTGP